MKVDVPFKIEHGPLLAFSVEDNQPIKGGSESSKNGEVWHYLFRPIVRNSCSSRVFIRLRASNRSSQPATWCTKMYKVPHHQEHQSGPPNKFLLSMGDSPFWDTTNKSSGLNIVSGNHGVDPQIVWVALHIFPPTKAGNGHLQSKWLISCRFDFFLGVYLEIRLNWSKTRNDPWIVPGQCLAASCFCIMATNWDIKGMQISRTNSCRFVSILYS